MLYIFTVLLHDITYKYVHLLWGISIPINCKCCDLCVYSSLYSLMPQCSASVFCLLVFRLCWTGDLTVVICGFAWLPRVNFKTCPFNSRLGMTTRNMKQFVASSGETNMTFRTLVLFIVTRIVSVKRGL